MIAPFLVAAGTFLVFVARERPRAGFAWAATAYFGLTRLAEPQLRRSEALMEPSSLVVLAAWGLVGCVAFVPALRRSVWTRWAFHRARRLASRGDQGRLVSFADWEHELDAGRADAAMTALLADTSPKERMPTGPGFRAKGPDPVEAALADDERSATSEIPGPQDALERHVEAWNWARTHNLLGLELPSDWAGHGFDTAECAAAVRRAASQSVERGLALALANLGSVLGLVLRYGSAQQRVHWVPRLASGDEAGAVAWIGDDPSGPRVGAELVPAKTSATAAGEPRGQNLNGATEPPPSMLRLDGSVTGIPSPVRPTVLAVTVTVEDPSGLATSSEPQNPTLLLLPVGTEGVRLESAAVSGDSLPSFTLHLSDVAVPLDAVLGGAEQLGAGLDAGRMAMGMQHAVALSAVAAGLAQREARLVSSVESVAPAQVEGHAAWKHLARIATGTVRLSALSRATAAAAATRILSSTEVAAVASAAHDELRAVLGSSDAVLEARPNFGVALTRPTERTTILGLFDLMTRDSITRHGAPRAGAALSAAVTREHAAAQADDLGWFDLERSAHASATAATWIRALWSAPRAFLSAQEPTTGLDLATSHAIELHARIAAAAARMAPSSASRPPAVLALDRARSTLTSVLLTTAIHAVDDRQSSDHVLFHSSQTQALCAALESLGDAASALPRRWTRAVAPIALAGVRRRLARISPDDAHVARAFVGNRDTRARLTRDVHVDRSVAAWDQAASIAGSARTALAQLTRAQDRGQLPAGQTRGLLELAVDRGIISERDRWSIEERQRGPRAITAAASKEAEPGASRAVS